MPHESAIAAPKTLGLSAPSFHDPFHEPWNRPAKLLLAGAFGQELASELAGEAPRLIQAVGVLAIATGLLRRDHMDLTKGPVSWHNEAHTIVSPTLYAGPVSRATAPRPAFPRAGATHVPGGQRCRDGSHPAVFLPNTTSAAAGVLHGSP
jgi:hypothetical protein